MYIYVYIYNCIIYRIQIICETVETDLLKLSGSYSAFILGKHEQNLHNADLYDQYL